MRSSQHYSVWTRHAKPGQTVTATLQKPDKQTSRPRTIFCSQGVIIWSCVEPLISWLRLRSKQDNSDGTCSPHCAAQQMTWKPLSTQLSSAYHILTAATPADAKFQGSFVFKYKTYNNTPRSPSNILCPA